MITQRTILISCIATIFAIIVIFLGVLAYKRSSTRPTPTEDKSKKPQKPAPPQKPAKDGNKSEEGSKHKKFLKKKSGDKKVSPMEKASKDIKVNPTEQGTGDVSRKSGKSKPPIPAKKSKRVHFEQPLNLSEELKGGKNPSAQQSKEKLPPNKNKPADKPGFEEGQVAEPTDNLGSEKDEKGKVAEPTDKPGFEEGQISEPTDKPLSEEGEKGKVAETADKPGSEKDKIVEPIDKPAPEEGQIAVPDDKPVSPKPKTRKEKKKPAEDMTEFEKQLELRRRRISGPDFEECTDTD